jgi:hypothetical protein
MQQKFDYKELMKHKGKTIIKERNKPNFDRMAEAFAKLLKK